MILLANISKSRLTKYFVHFVYIMFIVVWQRKVTSGYICVFWKRGLYKQILIFPEKDIIVGKYN